MRYLGKSSSYEEALCELVNAHLVMDVLLVLYMRARCLEIYQDLKEDIREFLLGN